MRDCGAVERVVVHAGRWPGQLSIIGLRIEIDHTELFFEQVYAWDEGLPLDAIFVQVVWVAVGGGDEDDAVGH